jgi:hypothetical protein
MGDKGMCGYCGCQNCDQCGSCLGNACKCGENPMKIAFDVKGTLDNPHDKRTERMVLALLETLQKQGHEIIVWSNSFGYAVECVNKLGLKNVRAESKSDKWSRDEANWYDVCIEDDTSQTYLAAKRIIFVKDIAPLAMGGIIKLAQEISK